MRITRIAVYQVDLPYPLGTYHMSNGRAFTSLDNTVVEVETDAGITGWGETCPFGTNYLPASAEGARSALAILAPGLIGLDPRRPGPLYQEMDSILLGHGFAKSGLDMAFWDILGKAAGLPLCELWGGRFEKPLIVKHKSEVFTRHWEGDLAAACREDACRLGESRNRVVSAKATGDIDRDIEIADVVTSEVGPKYLYWMDANSGWTFTEALKIGLAMEGRNILFEQPCVTYEECRELRQRIPQSIILDEVAVDLRIAHRAAKDGLLDHYNMKTARVGGLTKALKIRDFCVEMGVPVHYQDTWGAELSTAAMLHLAQSTPDRSRTEIWPMNYWSVARPTAQGLPEPKGDEIEAGREPGLGIQPLMNMLGDPVAVYE